MFLNIDPMFAFTITFTFSKIKIPLLLVQHLPTASFKILINTNLKEMQGFFASLGSARFRLSGSSFLVTFDTV